MTMRRYVLRFIVAALCFFVGVAAAVVLGSINPFQFDHQHVRIVRTSSEMPVTYECTESRDSEEKREVLEELNVNGKRVRVRRTIVVVPKVEAEASPK